MSITSAVPPPLPPDLPALSATPPPRRRWRWWLHLFVINLMPLLAVLSALPGLESTGPALGRSTRGLIIVSVFQLLLFALIFGLAWIFSRASRDDLLLRRPRGGIWTLPLALLYSIGMRVAVGIAVMIGYAAFVLARGGNVESVEKSAMNNRPQIETMVDMGALRDNPAYFWLTMTLVSFVLAGLREELWRSAFLAGLRALWPQRFSSRAGQILAVGVASLFFGVAHLRMGPLAVAMTTLLGFGLGVIMVLHRSIWPAVITHGLFNATTFALLPWLAEKLPELQKTLGH